ncbi:MAG: hypothetical protein C4527_09540 [Candidatus Omnitrophota bacterium]|jgi:flagellar biosynthesis/type III secretory pathway chaperone|nr:MAG: hypothetical protein C4527_09540 [Candidatus Omnitrophota bacterium]
MNLKTLIDILRNEQKVHEKILAAKKQERRCLAVGDAKGLLKITETIQDLVDEVTDWEKKRLFLTGEIARQLGIEKEQPTLRDLLTVLPPENNAELEKAGSALRELLFRLRLDNQSNKQMLENAIETMNLQFSDWIKPKESGVYNRQGHKGKPALGRAGLNVRA